MKTEVTNEEIKKFLARTPERGAKILATLAKQEVFADAISSNIGQELLTDLTAKLDSCFEKIVSSKTDEDIKEARIAFNVYKELSIDWIKKIVEYNKTVNTIKEESSNPAKKRR